MPDDNKAAWIKLVLGVEISGQGGQDGEELDDDTVRKQLITQLADAISLSAGLPQDVIQTIRTMVAAARDAIKGPDLDAALTLVEQLEDFREEAVQKQRLEEAQKSAGLVQYRKLWFEWKNAQSMARQDLVTLAQSVLADEEMQDSPLWEDVADAAEELEDLMPPFDPTLEATLHELEDVEDKATAERLREEALQQLGKCDELLAHADTLERIQKFADSTYGGFESFRMLRKTLEGLRQKLAA
jgi:hypothetical protein